MRVASSMSWMPWRVAQRAQLAHVGHRHRLAAGHVHRAREEHVRDLGRRPTSSISACSLARSTLPLNGCRNWGSWASSMITSWNVRARQLLVEARGREVHVAGDVVAGLDQRLADEVLRAAALVGGHDVAVAVEPLDRRLEVVEVAAARVRLVAQHHPGPLAVAHGGRAGVGQQVDVDVVRAEQERVVAGLVERRDPLLAGGHLERLDHLDLPGLGPGAAAVLLAHGVEAGRAFLGHRGAPAWAA